MKKANFVSFPRSGHHLLVDCLCQYFANDLLMRSFGKEIVFAGDFSYCEYYTHCRKIPCSNENIKFQKNHDFGLELENDPNKNYIIQYRKPIDTMVSWFEFEIERLAKKISAQENESPQDTKQSFEHFAESGINFWNKFMEKWIISNKNKNTLFISYEDLLSNPYYCIKSAIKFISPEEKINFGLIRKIVKNNDIKKIRTLKKFKHYDKDFFEKMKKNSNLIYKKLKNANLS